VVGIFVLVGLIPLTVVTFFPERFEWFGGPRPWYAPLVVLAFVVAVVAFVVRAIGSLHPVSVDGRNVFVDTWLGETSYPLSAVRSVRVDRERRIGGQNPLVVDLVHEGGPETVSFLIVEELDRGDVARLLGVSSSGDSGLDDSGRRV
jgi:hypothetical protein